MLSGSFICNVNKTRKVLFCYGGPEYFRSGFDMLRFETMTSQQCLLSAAAACNNFNYSLQLAVNRN